MSAIPPNANVLGTVLQSGAKQAEQSRQTDADKNAQIDRARATGAGPDGILEVEETDVDTQVHADSGSAGGQGRFNPPPDEEEEEEKAPAPDEGITVDVDGNPHVDLSV